MTFLYFRLQWLCLGSGGTWHGTLAEIGNEVTVHDMALLLVARLVYYVQLNDLWYVEMVEVQR